MLRSPLGPVVLAALASLGVLAPPARACDDDDTQVFSAPMTIAYGGAAFAPSAGYGSCGGSPQQDVVIQQAPRVIVQRAPAVVYRQAAPVVVRQASPVLYGGSSGLVGRGVGFAPGVGGGGVSAGRKVVIRNSQVGAGAGVSAGRKVRIRNSQVGF